MFTKLVYKVTSRISEKGNGIRSQLFRRLLEFEQKRQQVEQAIVFLQRANNVSGQECVTGEGNQRRGVVLVFRNLAKLQ